MKLRAPAAELKSASFEALEQRLEVRRRAGMDAGADQPASAAASESAVEAEIRAACAAHRVRLIGLRSAAAAHAEVPLAAIAGHPLGLERHFSEARLAVQLAEGRAAAAFARVREAAHQAGADLESFRRRHDLRRPAAYPDSIVLSVALLVAVAAFEAVFSAALFARSSDSGLIGGAVLAGGLAGANVTLGFLAGFLGLRYLGHRQIAMRIAGAGAALIGLGLAVALNLYAAFWRDHAGLAERLIEAQKLTEKLDKRGISGVTGLDQGAQLFGLSAPEAAILLMLGGGAWVFAALKGYSGVDDPYPDYGKLDRAAKDAADALAEERETLREELEDAIAPARDAVRAGLDGRREALITAEAAYEQAAKELAALDADARKLDDVERALISLYREENARRRKTPPPGYFTASAPPPAPLGDALERAGALLMQARQSVADGEAEAGRGLAELGEALAAAEQRLVAPS